MFKIIIYGDFSENLIGLKLCRTLAKYGGVLHLCNGDINEISVGSPYFLVYETEHLNSLQIENTVVIFNNTNNLDCPKIPQSCNISCIVNSQDSSALSKLLSLSTPTIVCGMSAKDSITISSIGETQAVISIQREITLLSGKNLEPCEFKVANIDKVDEEDLLIMCAILILFEKFDNGLITI